MTMKTLKLDCVGPLVSALFLTLSIQFSLAQSPEQGPFWFKFSDSKTNEVATQAVDEVSQGIVYLISALNGGRKNGTAVDVDNCKQAIASFGQAVADFEKLSVYIGDRKIDTGTIKQNNDLPVYIDLLESIKQAWYSPPSDGRDLTNLLEDICRKSSSDLHVLTQYSVNKKAVSFKDAERAAFDLILQKILLEKLGATMNILTVAMQ